MIGGGGTEQLQVTQRDSLASIEKLKAKEFDFLVKRSC